MVKAPMLTKIIEYLTHYKTEAMKTIPKPLKAKSLKDVVGEWYNNFLVSLEGEDGPSKYEKLFELVLAANFMDIKPLMSLACAGVALQMKDKKSPKEIATHFGITRNLIQLELKRNTHGSQMRPIQVLVANLLLLLPLLHLKLLLLPLKYI